MHISTRWLARHVDLTGLSPQEIAADLTLSTAEVEGLERFAPCLSDVTVGRVVTRVRHPDSDHLNLCTVDLGQGEPVAIVCGAPNVDAGQRVAVATVGTRLPGDVRIKKTKIRGVESNGMICSERELGLGDEHAGIWVLPADASVGRPVAEALGLEDWVIEIDNKSITHRPDLWGHRGIAREIAAIRSRALKPLDTSLPTVPPHSGFPVRVESKSCSRFLALTLEGARNGRSPDWLRHLLLAVGQRPIDLFVDVSNFVMLDLGQPNHLFDRRRLSPEGIVVRDARAGESLTTLDGVERALAPGDLLITSGGGPVGLAGIMGGERTKVEADTRELVLECATFHPAVIRRTSARLGLRTDASARYEKNLSPTLARDAAGHLVRTLQAIQPATVLSGAVSEAGEWTSPARSLRFRPARARAVLGAEIPDAEMRGILDRLELRVTPGAGEWSVAIPAERATKDLTAEHDLIEEIGRIHRYGRIAEAPLVGELTPPPRDPRRELVRRVEDRLSGGAAFHQAILYSFVSDDLLAKLGLVGEPHVAVVNPVAEGFSRIRRGVAPSLLSVATENRRHRADVRLFEIGKGYLPIGGDVGVEPREVHELGVLWSRAKPTGASGWRDDLLLALQGALEDVIEHIGLDRDHDDCRVAAIDASALPPWANSGRAKRLGKLGFLCYVDPGAQRALGLTGELASETVIAVLDVDALLAAPRAAPGYRANPRFPGTKLDVALALPSAISSADAVAAIRRAGKGLVASLELFDVYQGPNLAAGTKSLAWHVLLIDPARTLDDQDGRKFLARLEREVAALGGSLRSE